MVHSFKINRILLANNSMSIYETKLKAKKLNISFSYCSQVRSDLGAVAAFRNSKLSYFASLPASPKEQWKSRLQKKHKTNQPCI